MPFRESRESSNGEKSKTWERVKGTDSPVTSKGIKEEGIEGGNLSI